MSGATSLNLLHSPDFQPTPLVRDLIMGISMNFYERFRVSDSSRIWEVLPAEAEPYDFNTLHVFDLIDSALRHEIDNLVPSFADILSREELSGLFPNVAQETLHQWVSSGGIYDQSYDQAVVRTLVEEHFMSDILTTAQQYSGREEIHGREDELRFASLNPGLELSEHGQIIQEQNALRRFTSITDRIALIVRTNLNSPSDLASLYGGALFLNLSNKLIADERGSEFSDSTASLYQVLLKHCFARKYDFPVALPYFPSNIEEKVPALVEQLASDILNAFDYDRQFPENGSLRTRNNLVVRAVLDHPFGPIINAVDQNLDL